MTFPNKQVPTFVARWHGPGEYATTGTCTNPKCSFAHNPGQLRATGKFFKVQWVVGCQANHTDKELINHSTTIILRNMGDMKHGWYTLRRYHACETKCFGFARVTCFAHWHAWDVVEWTAELPNRPLADIAVQVPLAGPVPSWTGAFKSLIVQFSNVEALTIIDNDKRRVDKYHRHHHMTATATTTAMAGILGYTDSHH